MGHGLKKKNQTNYLLSLDLGELFTQINYSSKIVSDRKNKMKMSKYFNIFRMQYFASVNY